VRRRALIATVTALVVAAASVLVWRAALRPRDPAAALARATRTLARAPGDADAAWDRARALEALALPHAAIDAFEAIAARGDAERGHEAKRRVTALRALLQERERRARGTSPAAAAALERGTAALQRGDAAGAAREAHAGLVLARDANVDPSDLVRRFYVLLAAAARAQGQSALADAYVDEARLVMP